MAKWKCEKCGTEFDNFQAQGFNNEIYCPLCYFKELYKREKRKSNKYKRRIDKAIKRIYKIDFEPYQDEEGNYIVGMLTAKDMELLDILEYDEK